MKEHFLMRIDYRQVQVYGHEHDLYQHSIKDNDEEILQERFYLFIIDSC
jgi:hypothetical protein